MTVANTGLHLRGVVYLWSLDAASGEDLTVTELERANSINCESTISLLKSMAERPSVRGSRLWLVTRGAVASRGPAQPLNLAQRRSGVWAKSRLWNTPRAGADLSTWIPSPPLMSRRG